LRKRNYFIIFSLVVVLIGSILTGVLVPLSNKNFGSFSGGNLIENSAATFNVTQDVTTNFATYYPIDVDYTQVFHTKIFLII